MKASYGNVDALQPVTPPTSQTPPAAQPPPPPEPVAPQRRPATVTTAAGLMVLLTVYVLAIAGWIMYMVVSIPSTPSDGPEADADLVFAKALTTVVCLGYLLVGIGVIGLAAVLLRGWNWARITTFAAYGVFFTCAVLGVLGMLSVDGSFANMNSGMTLEEIQETVFGLFVFGSHLVIMLATVGLLAMPVSSRWFKAQKRQREADRAPSA